jgi:hypothetical protein
MINMRSKIPLYEYLRREVGREFPSIPSRAILDLIAWALEFKNYESARHAHLTNKIDLNDPDATQKQLRKWKDGELRDFHSDTSLLKNLCSENKSSALQEIDIADLILCLNTALIIYHPEVLNCHSCNKELVTTVENIEFIMQADNDDEIFAVLCQECLAKELAKNRNERTIYAVDGSYRHV